MGAESVTCIDVQKPAAFAHEIAHIEALGGKLLWPVMTKEITDGGLITADGTLISGDMVIITIGESPDWATCLKACGNSAIGSFGADMSLRKRLRRAT